MPAPPRTNRLRAFPSASVRPAPTTPSLLQSWFRDGIIAPSKPKLPVDCASCRFSAWAKRAGLGCYIDVIECRRTSPTGQGWPQVAATDVCGEYRAE